MDLEGERWFRKSQPPRIIHLIITEILIRNISMSNPANVEKTIQKYKKLGKRCSKFWRSNFSSELFTTC